VTNAPFPARASTPLSSSVARIAVANAATPVPAPDEVARRRRERFRSCNGCSRIVGAPSSISDEHTHEVRAYEAAVAWSMAPMHLSHPSSGAHAAMYLRAQRCERAGVACVAALHRSV